MLTHTDGPERRNSLLHQYGTQLGRILDRNQAELAFARGVKLRRVDALMRNVVESSFDGIITFREGGSLETANPAALGAFGLEPEHLSRTSICDLLPELAGSVDQIFERLRSNAGHQEMTARRPDGQEFPIELSVSETRSEKGPLYVAIVRDITERKAQEAQLQHQALHDNLTGLPNRALLHDRLNHSLDLAQRMGEPMALLLLDLDRFKDVNDTLGHQVGDLVLTEVAGRLNKAIRSSDTIARLGGDEFAILLPAVSDLERARRVAERITEALLDPFRVIEGLELEVGVSIGIALYPEHADEGGKLLQCADVAMYTAKTDQLGIALYDHGKDHHSVRHLTLTGELRHAIDEGLLSFHYQPKIDIKSEFVVSVEALARWIHPVHGNVPPDEFILHAERTGLIGDLTRWAFDTALKDLVNWQQKGFDLSIAINLSARNLHEEGLPDMLDGMIRDYGVEPDRLVLEITESAIMIDPERAMEVVERLADLGFMLSIDDFGTGYSSLSYLRRLPVQELKIDQSFVAQMDESDGDLVIVRSTIDLAHNLGLTVVAEGIESGGHITLLRELGCDVGQGFHISQPLRESELTQWLENSDWHVATRSDTAAAKSA